MNLKMALGKNLKRQKLIPDEVAAPKKKAKATRKTTAKAKKTGTVKKKSQTVKLSKSDINVNVTAVNITSESVPEVQEVTPEPIAIEESPKSVATPTKVLSEAEYKRRQDLKAKFSRELEELKGKKLQLIVFKLGEGSYALEIDKTREVVVTPTITRTPHAPQYIKGVAKIRGNAFVVMDLAEKYNLTSDNSGTNYTVVIESEIYKAGILVRDVPTTLIVSGDELGAASGIMSDTALDETYIKGIIEKDDQMIFLIDIEELIEGDKVSFIPKTIEAAES